MKLKSKKKPGLYWHNHHEELIEWCYNYKERADFIRTQKAEHERETRLRLFQPVKGTLPEEVMQVGEVYGKAWEVWDKAWEAYGKARKAYRKAWIALDKKKQTYDQAEDIRNKAGEALDKAGEAFGKALSDNMPAIEKLHKEECPDCPWDGKTIFPEAA